jgi:hypothetical protein
MHEKPLNFGQLRGRDIRNDEVLIRSQAKLALMYLCNLLQRSFEVTAGLILNATVFDEASEMMVAILASLPTKVVNVTVERIRPGRLKLEAKKFLHLSSECIKAHPINSVLQTSILSAGQTLSAERGKNVTRKLTQHDYRCPSVRA